MTTPTLRAAAQAALDDALDSIYRQLNERIADDATTPITLSMERATAIWNNVGLLRAALAQPEPVAEPVAWRTFDGEGGYDYRSYDGNERYRAEYISRNGQKYTSWVEPLYAAPPQRIVDDLGPNASLSVGTPSA